MSALTVPGVCLDLLQWRATCCMVAFRAAEDGAFAMGHATELPIDWEPGDRVLVAQSEGALLRVLARHLGWDGVGRVTLRREDGKRGAVWWVVRNLTEFGLPPEVYPDDGPLFVAKMPRRAAKYKHSYHEALAAAVCWYARIARLAAWDATTFEGEVSEAAQLEWVEARNDWPPLEVTTL